MTAVHAKEKLRFDLLRGILCVVFLSPAIIDQDNSKHDLNEINAEPEPASEGSIF